MHWIALQPLLEAQPNTQVRQALGLDVHRTQTLDECLTAWAWWALQFTPKVVRMDLHTGAAASTAQVGLFLAASTSPTPRQVPQQALLMEVSASERLFGGRSHLLAELFHNKADLCQIHQTRSATGLVALAKLQWAPDRSVHQRVSASPKDIDALPLVTLAAARPHLKILERVGVRTWGQLKALPRGGVVRRFGADLLGALDRAYGLQPEIYPWLTLPDVFSAQLELANPVENAPALLFGAQRLLKQLQLWLQLRQHGVTLLQLGWTMDARRNTATQGHLQLRTAQATQDTAHLQRLVAEHLARTQLPAPALYLQLQTLHTEPLAGSSASLLLQEVQKGDSLHEMVERLQARLGAAAVQQIHRHNDHRPERMQSLEPVFSSKKESKIAINNVSNYIDKMLGNKAESVLQINHALYPNWLLAQPLPLAVLGHTPHYQGPLQLLAGPQRIEVGWWAVPYLRDYYIAQSPQAGLLWVYRERLGGVVAQGGKTGDKTGDKAAPAKLVPWYLHGLFA